MMGFERIVDRAWASSFGITVDALHRPGTTVIVNPPGIAASRVHLLHIHETCIVTAPNDDVAVRVRHLVEGADPDRVFTPEFATTLVGDAPHIVLGPSQHSYLHRDAFVAPAVTHARRTTERDAAAIERLRQAVSASEWEESGFVSDPVVVWGSFAGDELVALGNMTEFAGAAADVGLITRPEVRGQGHAGRVARAMIAAGFEETDVVRYRALVTNTASLAVAHRLGFTGYGRSIVVRLQD